MPLRKIGFLGKIFRISQQLIGPATNTFFDVYHKDEDENARMRECVNDNDNDNDST